MAELKITAANFENEVLRSDKPVNSRCIIQKKNLPDLHISN